MTLFPFLLRLQGYPFTRAIYTLKQIQAMSADERRDWQERKRWEIVRFHYNNNNYYKQKIGAHLPDKWEELPIIQKKDLQRPLMEIITNSTVLKKCYTGSTSGSSGIPFFFAKDKFAHAMTWALIAHRYAEHGISIYDKSARFYGIPKERKAYIFEKAKDKVMNRTRFTVFTLSDAVMENWLHVFKRTGFQFLYGYTSVLVLFARYLLRNQILLKEFCPTIKLCISTSETATAEDHLLMQQAFGVKHIREYGVSETCLTGFDNPSGDMLLTDETLYNEVISGNYQTVPDNEAGRLLSTSLFNTALPMIRYDVGDSIVLSAGRNSKVIKELKGRTNDIVHLPNGNMAAGLSFYYIARSILEPTGVLKEFIIRQTAINHFVFDVVTTRKFTNSEVGIIKQKLALYLHPGLEITINRLDSIERTAAGKLKHFHSELSQP